MKFCPIVNRVCEGDGCALNIDGECGVTNALIAIQDISVSLDAIERKLPDMEGRENFDLFVQANVLGAIDTYEQ